MNKIENFGPFRFITNGEKMKPVIQEMYNKNYFFKKIVDSNCPKVNVIFEDEKFKELEKEESLEDIRIEGYYDRIKRNISIRNNCEYLKTNLIHEYIHFIQDMNIRKNFPGLTMDKIFSKNTLYNFALSLLCEIDAYTKEYIYETNLDYIDKHDARLIFNYEIEFLLYKYNLWGYAENFDFVNMKKNVFNKEKFIKIADCISKSLTDEEYGGRIFPKYDLDWHYIFEELKKAYISNRNFDIIAIAHNYQDSELMDVLSKKLSGDKKLIKKFFLNYKGLISYNNEKKKLIKCWEKER